MCMGSTARGGERYTDHILIWTHINYRQSDAKEFWILSYFHFVRVLEGPWREMIDCRVFRAWCYYCFLLSIMCTFLSSKSARHPLKQNMPIERSARKCVHGVLRCGVCPEEVGLCGRNRWCVHLACGCLAYLLLLFCPHMDCLVFKNVPMFRSLLPQDCLHIYLW